MLNDLEAMEGEERHKVDYAEFKNALHDPEAWAALNVPNLSSPKDGADGAEAGRELLAALEPLKRKGYESLTASALHDLTGGCGMSKPTFKNAVENPLALPERTEAILSAVNDCAEALPKAKAARLRGGLEEWERRYFDGELDAAFKPLSRQAAEWAEERERQALLSAYDELSQRDRATVFSLMASLLRTSANGSEAEQLTEMAAVMEKYAAE